MRMKRPVLNPLSDMVPLVQGLQGGGREARLAKTSPYIFNGHPGWMNHIVGIEAIVTQFIHQDFVSGKVTA